MENPRELDLEQLLKAGKTVYYLEKGNPMVAGLCGTVAEVAYFTNLFRYRGRERHKVVWVSRRDVGDGYVPLLKPVIPVGSLGFVEQCIQRASDNWDYHIRPINVPKALQQPPFCTLKVADNVRGEDIDAIAKSWGEKRVFVKSATAMTKIDNLYDTEHPNLLSKKDLYFVREIIPKISSEWRIFVHNGMVVDARRYIGGPWSEAPNKKWATEAIKAYEKDAPASYTLDVAIEDDGTHHVIEVHNLISCGLYGMDDPMLLAMLRNGYRHELNLAQSAKGKK